MSLTSCTAKDADDAAPSSDGKSAPAEITVTASDTACELSGTEAGTGANTFNITNNGTKVTEFYVYGEGERVMGEVENISPGLSRKLVVQLGRAGQVPDRLQAGHDRRRPPRRLQRHRRHRADRHRGQVQGSRRQLQALREQPDRRAGRAPPQVFVDAVKKGDVDAAKAQFPIARTYYERIEPVAESFPDDLDPRIDLREADLEPGQKWTGFHALEKQLWVTGLQPDANALADQLVADVKELDAGVKAPDCTIDSTQIAGGAQGLLDEVSASKISGEEDIFSHTDLWDFQANVDGSQTAVASVRPILDERNADLGKRVDQRFAEVERAAGQVPPG